MQKKVQFISKRQKIHFIINITNVITKNVLLLFQKKVEKLFL